MIIKTKYNVPVGETLIYSNMRQYVANRKKFDLQK